MGASWLPLQRSHSHCGPSLNTLLSLAILLLCVILVLRPHHEIRASTAIRVCSNQSLAPATNSAPAASGSSQALAAAPVSGAAGLGSRTLFVLRTSSSHLNVLAEYKKMQTELGIDNCYLTFDDTAAGWPHSPTIRMTEPRPSSGAPHVLLVNRTECHAAAGADANWGECLNDMEGICSSTNDSKRG